MYIFCGNVCHVVIGFLYPKVGSQKATLVDVVLIGGISSPRSRNPEDFLNTQQNATKLCIYVRVDIAHRSTVSDFHSFSN